MDLKIVKGDITKIECDAIINAANTSLLGGGGVDGAIHRVAGPGLLAECRTLNGCKTGEAKLTKAYNLPAKYVIHTVGPVWKGGHFNEAKKLSESYYHSCELADRYGCQHIAFPAISTGAFGYPLQEAAEIAIRAILDYGTHNHSGIKQVDIVCYNEKIYQIFSNILNQLFVNN